MDAKGNPLVFVCSRNFDPKTRDLEQAVRATIFLMDAAVADHDGQFSVFYDRTDFSMGKNLDIGARRTHTGPCACTHACHWPPSHEALRPRRSVYQGRRLYALRQLSREARGRLPIPRRGGGHTHGHTGPPLNP